MSVITARHVHWAAQECFWQQSGELSVAMMMEGFLYAHRRRNFRISEADIALLGYLIDPKRNHAGFRTVGVQVGWNVKMQYTLVPSALAALVENQPENANEEEATEWFRQYEEIHPFVDGNGRTGSILYNWLRGSLHKPIHPPNLWDDPRRKHPDYPEPVI